MEKELFQYELLPDDAPNHLPLYCPITSVGLVLSIVMFIVAFRHNVAVLLQENFIIYCLSLGTVPLVNVKTVWLSLDNVQSVLFKMQSAALLVVKVIVLFHDAVFWWLPFVG